MSWIQIIPYKQAPNKLKKIYDRVRTADGHIDHILLAHSLRPHTLEGHMKLYKNVLHHRANTLPKWLLECVGVWVSLLNECTYCVTHHAEGLRKLLDDPHRFEQIMRALTSSSLDETFTQRERSILKYAQALTREPAGITSREVQELRDAGLDDGEILELNQVIAYFAYANRTVLGLGVELEKDHIGLSPASMDDEENWMHH